MKMTRLINGNHILRRGVYRMNKKLQQQKQLRREGKKWKKRNLHHQMEPR